MSELSFDELGKFDSLGSAEAAGMQAEIRAYPRVQPREQTWSAPTNLLSFQYRPGVKLWAREISSHPSEFSAEGPLTFRGRSATWQTKTNGCPQTIVTAAFDAPLAPAGGFCASVLSIDDFSMIEIMRLLHDEVRNPGFANASMLESISEILQIKLCRLIGGDNVPVPKVTALAKVEIDRIQDYVLEQRGNAPTVTELAQLLNMSRRNLLRRFKAATSMTVASYIAEVQLAKVKTLLVTSDMNLKQVAYETGFKNQSNFAQAFKRVTGQTPTEFRKHARR